MKRILGLAALLGQSMAMAAGFDVSARHRGGRTAKHRPYYPATRPTASRWWHDLEQPGQCARLQAAKDKRQRRAQKLDTWAFLSADNNRAHYDDFDNLHVRLNPFYQPPVTE